MKVQRGRAMRLLAGTVAGAMALSVSPLLGLNAAGAADPLPPLADPIANGAVCDDAPGTNPFSDLSTESASTREVILCLVATELTSGTSATTYTPGGTVTRRQMALFIKRLADLLNQLETGSTAFTGLPAYDNVPDYADVAAEDPVFQEAIGQLTQAEIVGGFGDGTFRPGAPVSRRQMAAFVNRLQEFLTGTAYSTTNDYFDDDNGDSGEDDLNALASVGIFQGNGAGQVSPGATLTRRQMANILLRDVQVLFAADSIVSPFGAGMATLALSPTTIEVIEFEAGVDATTADDDRTYTASNLPSSSGGYHLSLVDANNVFVLSDGSYRFREDADTGLVDSGEVAARIVKVNGANVAAQQNVSDVQPQSGSITFTVDGAGTEAIIPVINVAGGSNARLNIDSNGRPTETFGVGGEIDYVPAEAADGFPASGDVLVEGPTFAALDGAVSDSTVLFRTGDTYRIGSGSSFATVTASQFHTTLSIGDQLRTCGGDDGRPASYSQTDPNSFCLTDSGPGNPTELVSTPGHPSDTAIDLTWTAAPVADSYNIYANAETCPATSLDELIEINSVVALETSYSVTGLDPLTTYCFLVTTVESGDESVKEIGTGSQEDDNTAGRTTSGPVENPTITSAALTDDPGAGALTVDDEIVLGFSEAMDPDTVEGATFSVVDIDGDTTTIVCAPAAPLPVPQPDNGSTTATCVLGNGADATVANDTLTITIAEDGDDDNAAGGNDAIEYALTITASAGLTDADDGRTVNVAASADKTIS